jgi:hypothetical protein
VVMSNVLSREKREQVIALGRLGWSLRRIEQATGVRRETAGEYLRVAGIALRRPGGWGRHVPAKPAINPITDSGSEDSKPAINLITDSDAKPASEVTRDPSARKPGCGPASLCEAYGELIAQELELGRNAMGIWQDLVDRHGFNGGYQSVLRYARKLRAATPPEARAIIETPIGEECQVDYGTGPMVRDPRTSFPLLSYTRPSGGFIHNSPRRALFIWPPTNLARNRCNSASLIVPFSPRRRRSLKTPGS